MSDLHLEFWPDNEDRYIESIVEKTPKTDLVALAGDIGVLATNYDHILKLLNELSLKSEKVVYVPGNHEGYHSTRADSKALLYKMHFAVPSNVTVCYNPFHQFKLEGYTIMCGTMWFPNLHPSSRTKSCLSDFFLIQGLEPEIYEENRMFIEEVKNLKEKTIIITHHSPSYQSIDLKYIGSELNQFFCNDLDFVLETPDCPITCWISGHLHDAIGYKIGNTRIISNPAGYPFEIKRYWKPETVEVE